MAVVKETLPILIIGLPCGDEWGKYLSDILIHDLIHSSTSTFMKDDDASSKNDMKQQILSYLEGKDLLGLSRKHNGTVILSESEVLDQSTGNVDMERFGELEQSEYQAVIVDDTCFVREPDITRFVMQKYNKGSSVIIMAIEGLFDLSAMNNNFGVNWKLSAYTKRDIKLTQTGKKIIGDGFSFDQKYTKSHFVTGGSGEELFEEYQYPENYEDEEDYPDGPPPPQPGSPVVTALKGSKSVSYFGFVNPLDVSYGAILLKLCYAAGSTDQLCKDSSQKKVKVARKKLQSVPDLLANGDKETPAAESIWSKIIWMMSLIVLFYFSFEMYLRMKKVSETVSDDEPEL